MDLGITGRRAAVAAASGGLGFATAAALAGEGVHVAICSRSAERIEAAADRIGAIPIVADVSTEGGAAGFVRDARAALGGVDILVANAGGPPAGGVGDVTLEQYRAAVELSFLSVVAMCDEVLPEMRAERWGRVLAVTSLTVRQPRGDLVLSNTALAAVTAYLKTLASAVAGDGVTVNTIQPGSHDTERHRTLQHGVAPTAPVGRPEDFGSVAAFLCSQPAAFLTGSAIHVDGGAFAGLQ